MPTPAAAQQDLGKTPPADVDQVRMTPFAKDAMSYVPGDVVAGRYRITGVLGRGGFGAVYAGEHLGTHQPVAIKMLTAGDKESDAAQRFYREARITARLTHPNTVRVFDVGQAENDGPIYLVMELLRGPSLEQVLTRLAELRRPMTEAEALAVADPILRSLSEAHAAGLVHRDLKPANVMLHCVPGSTPVVKVLDFGCSHTADSNLTSEGIVIGTPGYMSPEQCRGQAVDPRSDLYALGVILYRGVVGRLPFEDTKALTLMYRHANEPVPDPREVSTQEVSAGFAKLLLRALAKQPADRFADASDMRKELDAFGAQAVQTRIGHRGALANGVAPDPGLLLERLVELALRPRSADEIAAAAADSDEVQHTRPYVARSPAASPPPRPAAKPTPLPETDARPTVVQTLPVRTALPVQEDVSAQRWLWPLAVVAVAAIAGVVVLALRPPASAPVATAAAPVDAQPSLDPARKRAADLHQRASGRSDEEAVSLLAEAVQLAPGVPEYALALDAARKRLAAQVPPPAPEPSPVAPAVQPPTAVAPAGAGVAAGVPAPAAPSAAESTQLSTPPSIPPRRPRAEAKSAVAKPPAAKTAPAETKDEAERRLRPRMMD